MGTYQWHLIDRKDRVKSVEAVGCTSDADAMTKAAQILAQNPDAIAVEVWDIARLVGRAPRIKNGAQTES
jgi:hypothetical protein